MENTVKYYLIETERYRALVDKQKQAVISGTGGSDQEQNNTSEAGIVTDPYKENKINTETDSDVCTVSINGCFPKHYKNKALMLCNHLRNISNFHWDNKCQAL